MDSDLKIIPVVYMGGCCGDLITTLLDPTGAKIDLAFKKMSLPMDRQQLKKYHLFKNDSEKDLYFNEVQQKYTSIPSHDIDYHTLREHWFVGISVKDRRTADWAARRFKNAHRPEVWESVKKSNSINTVEEYADLMLHYSRMIETKTPNILMLEDIRKGHAIEALESLIDRTFDKKSQNIYINWHDMINGVL